ncbi:Alpha/Beta hydrolase protein [Mycena olivaceomarginata]|nr:Alpha/Beta hydrolase protein [Mycena olivaceomarginata]
MVLPGLFLGFVATATATAAVQPFRIDLAKGLPHLEALVKNTNLPSEPLYPGAGEDLVCSSTFLRDLKTQWVEGYNWTEQEAELNQLAQYTTTIGKQTVHFVHEKSDDEDAIPLLLIHGWPGLIPSRHQIADPALDQFDREKYIVQRDCPSLPGFLFSSPPPQTGQTLETAYLFNTLMTDVLGYSKYALHGTDWGSHIGYHMYESFNTTVRAAHFVFLPFRPPSPQEIADKNITLSDVQKIALQRTVDWRNDGSELFAGTDIEGAQPPTTLVSRCTTHPVGQLAWIGGNIKLWSDPRAGTGPSALTHTAILTSVSLYYLTGSFQSSVWQYARNAGASRTEYIKPPTDAPMLYSIYAYNIAFWPQEYVEKVGNLVSYKEHDFGGHFAGPGQPTGAY